MGAGAVAIGLKETQAKWKASVVNGCLCGWSLDDIILRKHPGKRPGSLEPLSYCLDIIGASVSQTLDHSERSYSVQKHQIEYLILFVM